MRRLKKIRLNKKQLAAMHVYIFKHLANLAMVEYRKSMDLQSKNSSVKVRKDGTIVIDVKKRGKKK